MSTGLYSTQRDRPFLLTAIGVASMVIASLCLLTDLGSLIFSGIVVGMANVSRMPVTSPAPVAPAGPSHGEYVGPQGLSTRQRKIVIDALSQVRPLSDERGKQLDALLADVGQNVIRLAPENLSVDRVTAYVTDVREIPSGDGGKPADIFSLGSGRLQLSDQVAVFFPDNSPSPIRSRGGSYTDADGTHIAAEQIAAIVDRVRVLSQQSLNDAQAKSLALTLESTTQTLINPSRSVSQAAAQVVSASMLPDGTVAVTTQRGSMSFTPSGQSFPGVTAGMGMRAPWGMTGAKIKRSSATLLFLDTMVSFGAAAFLLACGIMTMRNAPGSRWMHIGYAIGKLLLVCLSCYAIWSVAMEMNSDATDARQTALIWMLTVGASGAIYPLVLLLAMGQKSVKDFLGAPTVARIF